MAMSFVEHVVVYFHCRISEIGERVPEIKCTNAKTVVTRKRGRGRSRGGTEYLTIEIFLHQLDSMHGRKVKHIMNEVIHTSGVM